MSKPGTFNEQSPFWLKQFRDVPRRQQCRNLLLIALILSLVISFLVTAVKSSQNQYNLPRIPSITPPFDPEQPAGEHGPYCSSAIIHRREGIPTYRILSGQQLYILQINDNERTGPTKVRTVGHVVFRQGDRQTGYISFDVWVSNEEMSVGIEMDKDTQSLKITTPSYGSYSPYGGQCISIEVTVWLPKKAAFEELVILTSQLSVHLLDGVDVLVSGKAEFGTYSGAVHFPSVDETTVHGLTRDQSSFTELVHGDESISPSLLELRAAEEIRVQSPDLGLPIDSDTSAGLASGPLKSGDLSVRPSRGFSARKICVETISGPIDGTFLLYDSLSIKSQSGSMDVFVSPRASDDDSLRRAKFDASTVSGSIRIHFPIRRGNDIPDRDFYTNVNTMNGAICGDFIIGEKATFRTVSGFISLAVLPFNVFSEADFATQTISGSTDITVLSPLRLPGRYKLDSDNQVKDPDRITSIDRGGDDPYRLVPIEVGTDDPLLKPPPIDPSSAALALRTLTSSHESTSGAFRIRYPPEWEGEINAESISGYMTASGPGVHIITDGRKDWVYKQLVARKGPDAKHASRMDVKGISGRVDVRVGVDCGGRDSDWCEE